MHNTKEVATSPPPTRLEEEEVPLLSPPPSTSQPSSGLYVRAREAPEGNDREFLSVAEQRLQRGKREGEPVSVYAFFLGLLRLPLSPPPAPFLCRRRRRKGPPPHISLFHAKGGGESGRKGKRGAPLSLQLSLLSVARRESESENRCRSNGDTVGEE